MHNNTVSRTYLEKELKVRCRRPASGIGSVLPNRIILGQTQPSDLILRRIDKDPGLVRLPLREKLVVVCLIPPKRIESLGRVGNVCYATLSEVQQEMHTMSIFEHSRRCGP